MGSDRVWQYGTIAHEFGHLLAFPHEHKLALVTLSNEDTFDKRNEFLTKVQGIKTLPDVTKFAEHASNLLFDDLKIMNGMMLFANWDNSITVAMDEQIQDPSSGSLIRYRLTPANTKDYFFQEWQIQPRNGKFKDKAPGMDRFSMMIYPIKSTAQHSDDWRTFDQYPTELSVEDAHMLMRMYPSTNGPAEAPDLWEVGKTCTVCERTKKETDTGVHFKFWNKEGMCFGCAYCKAKNLKYDYFCNACGGKRSIQRQLTTFQFHKCDKYHCPSHTIKGFGKMSIWSLITDAQQVSGKVNNVADRMNDLANMPDEIRQAAAIIGHK